MDYVSQQPDKLEALIFIFVGGLLDPAAIARLKLPGDELSEFRFCTLAEAVALVNGRLGRRISHCFAHLHGPVTLYPEDGCIL